MTTSGSVAIEHVNAVVVQANLPAGSGSQTKLGDLVYKGDVVQTGADGKVGITFTDGTAFNLSSNARMILNEFVYEPEREFELTLFKSDQGNIYFRCRQGSQDWRHEDRHPGRDHGNSRHHAAC